MAASESVSESMRAAYRAPLEFSAQAARRRPPSQDSLNAWIMMAADLMAVLLALCLASVFRFDLSPAQWVQAHPWLLIGHDGPMNPGYMLFFAATLLIINRRDGLYDPRKTVQACFATGLLLCGGLYVMRNTTISRGFVAYVIVLTTLFLCVLRALWRRSTYRKYERGVDTRNVLIVGTSHMGNAVRRQISRSAHLGRVFKGFLEATDRNCTSESQEFVLGDLKQLSPVSRQYFVDEIIIAERCPTAAVIEVIEIARQLDIEVLVIPGFYDELTPEAPIEYLGNLPVVALHRRNGKVIGNLMKRIGDFGMSLFLVAALLPILLIIALLIKLDSPGPVFYISHRIGKKGRVFPCYKFRTMVVNADELTHTLASLNERDGILFKITKDPRATKIGRVLRKFSLDELPQLFNVLGGDMSLVGPRPPLAREVGQYELEHFRRLEVLPGITGLWQVRARQDPSFTRYVALDLAYVENWSFWLDLKILVKTAEVVLRGTGS
jgi:exopolysaccharide biosynthesis polyprenyl glycosylphosphotransferase